MRLVQLKMLLFLFLLDGLGMTGQQISVNEAPGDQSDFQTGANIDNCNFFCCCCIDANSCAKTGECLFLRVTSDNQCRKFTRWGTQANVAASSTIYYTMCDHDDKIKLSTDDPVVISQKATNSPYELDMNIYLNPLCAIETFDYFTITGPAQIT